MLYQQPHEIIVICAVGFGTAVGCAVTAARRTIALRKAAHWPSVRGKIIESYAYHDKYNGYFRIRYEFPVAYEITSPTSRLPRHARGSAKITGSTPRLSGKWFWTSIQMDAFVARYPVGQEVEVFYDPENPRRNCLDREDRGGLLPLWFGTALAVICTALLAWASLAVATQ
jgi:hypothetical protein